MSERFVSEEPPRAGDVEAVGEVGSAAIGVVVPVVGALIAVAWQAAFGQRYKLRMEAYVADLAGAINDLIDEVDGLTPEALAADDVFLDALVASVRAAEATSATEKLEALRNAVLNSALTTAPEPDRQAVFFRLVDNFTVSHLRLLGLLADPPGSLSRLGMQPRNDIMMGSRMDLLRQAMPDALADGGEAFVNVLVRDLSSAGLIGSGSLSTTMTGAGIYQSVATPLGSAFLDFISDPRTSDGLPS